MAVLVTGGAGFIGSHTAIELLKNDYEVIILDNLSNSKEMVISVINKLSGKKVKFYKVDMKDINSLKEVFAENKIDSVIHFAGYKAVGESVKIPLKYYENNLLSTINLLKVMEMYNVNNIVFSSSATVYGANNIPPFNETMSTGAIDPYGYTKVMIEQILKDAHIANNNLSVCILRYFNPIGAHESGEIGEDPNGIPNNLIPYITQVAVGKRKSLKVFGNDYPTKDGTEVRDYIHVVDLAKGHIKALKKIINSGNIEIYNLGTGKGSSVLEVIKAFEEATGIKIPYEITKRREGDLPATFANPSKALKELDWKAEKSLYDMCKDSWRWQSKNPNGFN
ncbi:MAG: UDP-glucose 4-epimerase GalE [Clostridium sp.]|nr:UDP-glucose 4-epimerase GalE [Clostridium sp.]